jgi:hypothetical protein
MKPSFLNLFPPVNGVWLHGRMLARVKVRWFGEYLVVVESSFSGVLNLES